jgi:hypothetical protein
MAHLRKSRLDSGLGRQTNVLKLVNLTLLCSAAAILVACNRLQATSLALPHADSPNILTLPR